MLIASVHISHEHPCWTAGGGWKVFLEHPDEIARTIDYIKDNPIKIGEQAQDWQFISYYDDWPLHAGHSSFSPYAKALRAIGKYPGRFRDNSRDR